MNEEGTLSNKIKEVLFILGISVLLFAGGVLVGTVSTHFRINANREDFKTASLGLETELAKLEKDYSQLERFNSQWAKRLSDRTASLREREAIVRQLEVELGKREESLGRREEVFRNLESGLISLEGYNEEGFEIAEGLGGSIELLEELVNSHRSGM